MNDLISRQAAIDLFPNDALGWDTYRGYIAPHLARRMIEELPSAQPEIIRCKDCKYYKVYEMFGHTLSLCNRIKTTMADALEEDDYCSRAERKEE